MVNLNIRSDDTDNMVRDRVNVGRIEPAPIGELSNAWPDKTVRERSHEHVLVVTDPHDEFGSLWVVQYYDDRGRPGYRVCSSRVEAFNEADWMPDEMGTPIAITYAGRLIHVYAVED